MKIFSTGIFHHVFQIIFSIFFYLIGSNMDIQYFPTPR